MRTAVPWQLPEGFVRLKRALDFWQYGRWDIEGFDWMMARLRRHGLRDALINGELQAFSMTEAGELDAVPIHYWRGTYLWGEAYSTGLVTLILERGRIAGYLCVRRVEVEQLRDPTKRSMAETKSIDAVTVQTVIGECPAIGLVAEALAKDVERSTEKDVYKWLREVGPPLIQLRWPQADSLNFPSIARQINAVIRLIDAAPVRWIAPTSVDPVLRELAQFSPLLSAALQVFRLCQAGAVGSAPSGMVRPAEAEAELRRLVVPTVDSPDSRRLFSHVARIAIPEAQVSGGGRGRTPP